MKPMTPEGARRSLAYSEKYDTHLAIGHRRALETIAGMHEEWGYEYESLHGGRVTQWGFRSEINARWDMSIALRQHWDDHQPTRLVRRYVTEPEEA